jgi:membrane fusion protein, adhesin transport system
LPGWPAGSTGVFASRVVAVSPTPAADGKFRILLVPTEPWPDELALGTGTYGVLLLKNVPLWYEIWRQFNGFPPDYYLPAGSAAKSKKS